MFAKHSRKSLFFSETNAKTQRKTTKYAIPIEANCLEQSYSYNPLRRKAMQIQQYLMRLSVKASQARFIMFVTVGIILALAFLFAVQLTGYGDLTATLFSHITGHTHFLVTTKHKLMEDPPPPVPPYLFHF
jgi:type III secretory pathway component EscT